MREKTRKRVVFNEELNTYELRVTNTGTYIFDTEKMSIVREYLESGRPASEFVSK